MFTIRKEQMRELAKARAKVARVEMVGALRQQGYEAEEDPASGDLLVRDKEGGSVRVSSSPNRVTVTSGEGRTHLFDVDNIGRLIGITDPAGTRIGFEQDQKNRIVGISRGPGNHYRFELDDRDQVTAIEFPDQTQAAFAYDASGRLTAASDRNQSKAKYAYSEEGNLTRSSDWRGMSTSYGYSGPEIPTKIVLPNGASREWLPGSDGKSWNLLINGEQHLTLGAVPTEQDTYQAVCADGTRVRYIIKNGKIVEAVNDVCTVKFEYDEEGRILREETDGQVIEYCRNKVGALIGLTTPAGEKLEFHRDTDQRVKEIADWDQGRFKFEYAASGALSKIEYPNGVAARFRSNPMGLAESMSLMSPGTGVPFREYHWENDARDRVTAMTSNGERMAYGYDREGRLIADAGAALELDANGNCVEDSSGRSTFDAANQILTSAGQVFRHDARGNLITGPCPKGNAQFTYDGLDRLVTVRTEAGDARYFYDALGRRVRKEAKGAVTAYLWAGEQLLSEVTTSDGSVTRRDYLFFPELHMPLALRVAGKIRYLHTGRRLEVLCMTGSSAETLWEAAYSAFGSARIIRAKETQPWRLAGHYHDEETGLHYVMARHYNPALGRFLTPDPRGVAGGSLNFYTYCDGDPINKIDPTGEFIFLVIIAAVAIGAAIGAGIEAYKQHKQNPDKPLDWAAIGKEAAIGGAVGAVGAVAGLLLAPVAGGVAAAIGGVGGAMVAGGGVGGLVGGISQCANNAMHHKPLMEGMGKAVAIGVGVGVVTAGAGALWANRARQAAQEAEEAANRARQAEQELAEAQQAAKQPAPKQPESPEITADELQGKSRSDIRKLADEKGLDPAGDPSHPDYPRKWKDPVTGDERLRLDRGHVDQTTGQPYNNANAAGDHVHGYNTDGSKIVSSDGDPHFPTTGE